VGTSDDYSVQAFDFLICFNMNPQKNIDCGVLWLVGMLLQDFDHMDIYVKWGL